MRTRNTFKNVLFSLSFLLIFTILSFVSRRVFVDNLGMAYLGLTSLIGNVLSMLSLAELGIGSAIIYSLYAPLANKDYQESAALVRLYAMIYKVVALIVFVVGLVMLLFIKVFVKHDISVQFAQVVFAIYLVDICLSYLFAHKRSLLNADQKGYVSTFIDTLFKVIMVTVQIQVIIATRNLMLYVVTQVVCNLIGNLTVNYVVNRKYPHILSIRESDIPNQTKKAIKKNVKALMMHKLGDYGLNSTDDLVLSYFINLSTVGIYSNYYMAIFVLKSAVSKVFIGAIASLGNLMATDTADTVYEKYRVANFLNFWIVSTLTILMYFTLDPFIEKWLGHKFMINRWAYSVLIFNFYIVGMRYSVYVVKTAAGLYSQDKYAPVIQCTINMILSISLVTKFGLTGVLLGTAISDLTVPCWTQPYIVFKYVFGRSLVPYAKSYVLYALLTCLMLAAIQLIVGSGRILSWLGLICRAISVLSLVTIVYYMLFRKKKEYKYLANLLVAMLLCRKGNSDATIS